MLFEIRERNHMKQVSQVWFKLKVFLSMLSDEDLP